MDKREKGRQGEEQALAYLLGKGYGLLCRNYHARVGEIDLVMQQGERIVFVEVKRRAGQRMGSGLEAVTLRKQQNLCQAALLFLQEHGLHLRPARFDVISIGPEGLTHIENAFTTTN